MAKEGAMMKTNLKQIKAGIGMGVLKSGMDRKRVGHNAGRAGRRTW